MIYNHPWHSTPTRIWLTRDGRREVATRWYLVKLENRFKKECTNIPRKYLKLTNNHHKDRSHNDMSGRARMQIYHNMKDSFALLKFGDKYHWLTNFQNLKKYSHLSVRLEGEFECNNWFIRKHCTSNYGKCNTQKDLPMVEKVYFQKYITGLRKCRDKFSASTKNRTNMTETQGENKAAD